MSSKRNLLTIPFNNEFVGDLSKRRYFILMYIFSKKFDKVSREIFYGKSESFFKLKLFVYIFFAVKRIRFLYKTIQTKMPPESDGRSHRRFYNSDLHPIYSSCVIPTRSRRELAYLQTTHVTDGCSKQN